MQVSNNQRQWLVLFISGHAQVEGVIDYSTMIPTNQVIKYTAPDNTLLSYRYPRNALGGYGGKSNTCRPVLGRYRAAGTIEHGGGGGSGYFDEKYLDPNQIRKVN